LHSRNEYEGTGIGLATVRKIVERHGGTIDASGEVNVGAKFYVTLPLEQGNKDSAA
jgi:signal transduction histidine kinase